jgi:RES domain-containing protein
MNPAGIPYLYMAMDEPTALAETVSGPPVTAVVARFKAARALKVIDLTRLPPLPSVFDASKRKELEGLLFLRSFVESICQPVSKDASEQVDYVPSQVVSEYFAQVFRASERGDTVAGVVYPSAVRPRGRNVVLFPTERGHRRTFATAVYESATTKMLSTWADLSRALKAR